MFVHILSTHLFQKINFWLTFSTFLYKKKIHEKIFPAALEKWIPIYAADLKTEELYYIKLYFLSHWNLITMEYKVEFVWCDRGCPFWIQIDMI